MEGTAKVVIVDPLLNPLNSNDTPKPSNSDDVNDQAYHIPSSNRKEITESKLAINNTDNAIAPSVSHVERDILETTCLDYNDPDGVEDGNTHEYHFSQSNLSNEAMRYDDYTSHNSILGLLSRVKRARLHGNRLKIPGSPGLLPARGLHVLVWSLLCAPFAALGSAAFAVYYSALTFYAVYDYYVADAQALCPLKLPALLALLVAYPAFAAISGLALGLYAAVAQVTCDSERWTRQFFDYEKGFFGAICSATGLEHCCPYDITLARDTRRMKAAASTASAGAFGDGGHKYIRGAGLSVVPTNNIDEIANISGQHNMLDGGPEPYFTARIVSPPNVPSSNKV